jgi:hypothetical protein
MNTAPVMPLYSTEIIEINDLFNNLRKPCGKDEIMLFNRTYQRIYPRLSRLEKRHAEILVDALIDNLEDDRLAGQIYGVV